MATPKMTFQLTMEEISFLQGILPDYDQDIAKDILRKIPNPDIEGTTLNTAIIENEYFITMNHNAWITLIIALHWFTGATPNHTMRNTAKDILTNAELTEPTTTHGTNIVHLNRNEIELLKEMIFAVATIEQAIDPTDQTNIHNILKNKNPNYKHLVQISNDPQPLKWLAMKLQQPAADPLIARLWRFIEDGPDSDDFFELRKLVRTQYLNVSDNDDMEANRR